MISLNLILRKFKRVNRFTNSLEKIKYLLYIDDRKIFAKNESELETLIQIICINIQNIRMEFEIEKYVTLIMKKKSKKRNNERKRIAQS